jgi:hypothetical protein
MSAALSFPATAPWGLTALEASQALARGELTSEALVGACLERIAPPPPFSGLHGWEP